MNISDNELLRNSKGLMSVSVIDRAVAECIGVVPVLCIVGKTRTGKTWATTDWLASHVDDLIRVAYIDCKRIGFGYDAVLRYDEIERDIRKNHYPKLALDGIDIVVVDEPHANTYFVRNLVARTAPDAEAGAHRLVILLLQDIRYIEKLVLSGTHVRMFNTQGIQIITTDDCRIQVVNSKVGKGMSRNQREGYYNGHHKGKVTRWKPRLG